MKKYCKSHKKSLEKHEQSPKSSVFRTVMLDLEFLNPTEFWEWLA
jgi:hypothetical protein